MTDVNFNAHQKEAGRLRAIALEIETRAGIQEDVAEIPSYAGDTKIRDLYFSVKDKDLRKELITQFRVLMTHFNDYTPARIRDAELDLRGLESKGFTPPAVTPSIMVSALVWCGWSVAAVPGAIAGAVAGYFIGSQFVTTKRNEYNRELISAKQNLEYLEKELKRENVGFGEPLVFSDYEEWSGGKDVGKQPEPDIHWYSRLGDAVTVKKEIDNGVSPDLEYDDSYKIRPIHRASANGNADVIKVLLAAGADSTATDFLHNFTPLHFAAEGYSTETTELLIQAGCPIDALDRYRETPLHYAAKNGESGMIRALVKAGASVNVATDSFGSQPIHEAARAGRADAVKTLIELGADPSAPNAHGVTPLDFAGYGKGKRFEETGAVLKAAGAVEKQK